MPVALSTSWRHTLCFAGLTLLLRTSVLSRWAQLESLERTYKVAGEVPRLAHTGTVARERPHS